MGKTPKLQSDKKLLVAIASRLKPSELKVLHFALDEADEGVFRSNADSANRFFAYTGFKTTVFFTSVARLSQLGCLEKKSRGLYKINDLWLK